MDVKRWRKKATEREVWEKSFGRPSPCMGCSAKE
jgi:hypothetical protein